MSQTENLSIVAVGGGSPAGRGSDVLKEAVDLTGKEKGGNVLIIPTALPNRDAYNTSVAKSFELYREDLGLPVRTLHGFDTMPDESVRDELLEWADLVYISGGDTKKMMDIWKKYGIDSKLRVQALGGLVLSGISAGAIAPFEWGHSDSQHYHVEGDNWDFERVDGLGLIDAAITPHNNTVVRGALRQAHFEEMFENNPGVAIGFGVDNYAGLKIHGSTLELRPGNTGAGATIFDRRFGSPTKLSRLDADQPIPLSELGL